MLGSCRDCQRPFKELERNEFYVFYQCGCNDYKGIDRKTLLHAGEEYSLGSAGSLILACMREDCSEQHFRLQYFENPDIHRCFVHPDSRMVPIKVADLQEYWLPKWERLGVR